MSASLPIRSRTTGQRCGPAAPSAEHLACQHLGSSGFFPATIAIQYSASTPVMPKTRGVLASCNRLENQSDIASRSAFQPGRTAMRGSLSQTGPQLFDSKIVSRAGISAII